MPEHTFYIRFRFMKKSCREIIISLWTRKALGELYSYLEKKANDRWQLLLFQKSKAKAPAAQLLFLALSFSFVTELHSVAVASFIVDFERMVLLKCELQQRKLMLWK